MGRPGHGAGTAVHDRATDTEPFVRARAQAVATTNAHADTVTNIKANAATC